MKKYINQVTLSWGYSTPTTPKPSFVVREFSASTRSAASDAAWAWRTSEEGRAAIKEAVASHVPQGTFYSVECVRV